MPFAPSAGDYLFSTDLYGHPTGSPPDQAETTFYARPLLVELADYSEVDYRRWNAFERRQNSDTSLLPSSV